MKYFFFLRNLVRCHVPRLRVRRGSCRNSLLLSHQGSRVPLVSHHISGPGPDQYSCRQLSPSHCVHGSPAGRPKANILCSFTRGEFPFKSINNLVPLYLWREKKKSKLGKKILNIELVVSVILTICIYCFIICNLLHSHTSTPDILGSTPGWDTKKSYLCGAFWRGYSGIWWK